jgi:hypothetical protein
MSGTGIAGAQDRQPATDARTEAMEALSRAMAAYLTASDPTGCLPDDTAVVYSITNTGGTGVVITAGMIRAAKGGV